MRGREKVCSMSQVLAVAEDLLEASGKPVDAFEVGEQLADVIRSDKITKEDTLHDPHT